MSVLRFAEDFSRLVMSYMKENLNLKKSKPNNVIVPLTNEQIAYTVHHVLRALGIKDSENDNDNEFETKDLNQGSDISKPIPIISKINDTENNENTYRSENRSHLAVTDSGLSFSDTSLKTNEKEAENSLNILQNEKKFISRSNPMICTIGRSDTFCKEDQKINDDIQEDVFENSFCSSLNDIFIQSLEEIRESAVNITLKIDDLKKQASKQTQQSYPNSLLNFNRTSTITKKGPTKIRRSLTTFSGTSVSSKTHVVEKEDTLPDRRKSTGGACSITPKKLSTKLDSSVSKLDGLYNKMSPSLIPKNPKYAHVKSTIPKPTFITKKKP
ncbi:uncharacterized protein LOC126850908 isoform X1 [Cataglyphis hispanica]|uniref:uncharacterized protein LOC126850908 isoform X1 n=1 Tax=Cataglyphis hispanica TaxID=1086592 RepID=UPI00218000FD|nr:uncharacterized protein LOC126850908 isoform X1 [Cataglyphis hispanica]